MTTLILTKNKDRIQVFHLIYVYVCVCVCPQLILFIFQMYDMIRGVVTHSPHSIVSVDLLC